MPHVRLSPLQPLEDADHFAAILASGYSGDESTPREILEQTRSFLAANPRSEPWGSYLAWHGDTAVGVCAYKFPPDSAGVVEIAYCTSPAYEGRGYAKAMIAALFSLAASSGASAVVAHTLPETNASNAALQREGFSFLAEVIDAEDGPVWRWEKRV